MKRILFQGDSITDAIRSRDTDLYKGNGYPTLVAAQLGFEHPGVYEVVNRGVSGNRVVDLLARIKEDIINVRPDVLSILIGVNDVGHEFSGQTGIAADLYERVYDLILEEVKKSLPDINIMILEPFLLKRTDTEEHWEIFRSEVEKRAAAAKRLAEKHQAVFVPLLELFDRMAAEYPGELWLRDGVHPTAAGHELIKREWLKAFSKIESQN